MDDINEMISKLTDNDIQSTKGIAKPKPRTLRNCGKKKEKNEGLRIDLQGRTTGYVLKCDSHHHSYTEFD